MYNRFNNEHIIQRWMPLLAQPKLHRHNLEYPRNLGAILGKRSHGENLNLPSINRVLLDLPEIDQDYIS